MMPRSYPLAALLLAGMLSLPVAAQAQAQAQGNGPAKALGSAPAFDQLGADGGPFDPAKMRTAVSKSATLRSVAWNGLRELPVCWEDPQPQHEASRQRARAAVAQTWEAAANVRFTGWGACQPGEQAIRVAVSAREWPRAFVGRPALRRDTSVYLNFDMTSLAGFSACVGKVERCEAFTAVHEFGHVLGLIHEQDRPDTPETCRQSLGAGGVNARPSADLVMMTGYDAQSLMNYCSKRGWDPAEPLTLTAEDRIGVVAMFGARPAAAEPPKPPPRTTPRRRPVFVPD